MGSYSHTMEEVIEIPLHIACILFAHHTRMNSCMMEEVVAIHANDITGRPHSVRPCNTDLKERDIWRGPVLIGASAPLVRKAPLVQRNHTPPYVYIRQLAIAAITITAK